jgi:hypothetical protein
MGWFLVSAHAGGESAPVVASFRVQQIALISFVLVGGQTQGLRVTEDVEEEEEEMGHAYDAIIRILQRQSIGPRIFSC